MMAVRGVLMDDTPQNAAVYADVSVRSVQLWTNMFKKYGADGLRDLPGRGRDPIVAYHRIQKIILRLAKSGRLTPNKVRRRIRSQYNKLYSIGNIRKILRALGYSPKRSVTAYRSAAKKRTVTIWQSKAKIAIQEAKNDGFQIVIQDESIFVRTGGNGIKYWTPVGDPVVVRRSGSRERTVVYGALANNGTRLMRQYEKFDGATFVKYLEEARRKWVRVMIIMDNAPQHTGRLVAEYLENHGDCVRVLYLPKARPELSAIEALWKRAKYRLVTSEYYETLEELRRAVSEYFRTCSVDLDIYTYLERRI